MKEKKVSLRPLNIIDKESMNNIIGGDDQYPPVCVPEEDIPTGGGVGGCGVYCSGGTGSCYCEIFSNTSGCSETCSGPVDACNPLCRSTTW